MLFGTVAQAWVFVWMMAAGCAIGAWYGCMAALRRLLSAGVWLSLFMDLAFALGAAVLFCLSLVAADHGQFRLFCVAATILGFNMFAFGVFSPAKRAIRTTFQILDRIVVNIRKYRWFRVIFK